MGDHWWNFDHLINPMCPDKTHSKIAMWNPFTEYFLNSKWHVGELAKHSLYSQEASRPVMRQTWSAGKCQSSSGYTWKGHPLHCLVYSLHEQVSQSSSCEKPQIPSGPVAFSPAWTLQSLKEFWKCAKTWSMDHPLGLFTELVERRRPTPRISILQICPGDSKAGLTMPDLAQQFYFLGR